MQLPRRRAAQAQCGGRVGNSPHYIGWHLPFRGPNGRPSKPRDIKSHPSSANSTRLAKFQPPRELFPTAQSLSESVCSFRSTNLPEALQPSGAHFGSRLEGRHLFDCGEVPPLATAEFGCEPLIQPGIALTELLRTPTRTSLTLLQGTVVPKRVNEGELDSVPVGGTGMPSGRVGRLGSLDWHQTRLCNAIACFGSRRAPGQRWARRCGCRWPELCSQEAAYFPFVRANLAAFFHFIAEERNNARINGERTQYERKLLSSHDVLPVGVVVTPSVPV